MFRGHTGREVIQVVNFALGVAFGTHSHPGAKTDVLEGTLEYQLEGKPRETLKAGEALFIQGETIHAAKNGDLDGIYLAARTSKAGAANPRRPAWESDRSLRIQNLASTACI